MLPRILFLLDVGAAVEQNVLRAVDAMTRLNIYSTSHMFTPTTLNLITNFYCLKSEDV